MEDLLVPDGGRPVEETVDYPDGRWPMLGATPENIALADGRQPMKLFELIDIGWRDRRARKYKGTGHVRTGLPVSRCVASSNGYASAPIKLGTITFTTEIPKSGFERSTKNASSRPASVNLRRTHARSSATS